MTDEHHSYTTIRRIYCQYQCGYFRDVTDSQAWEQRIIHHPIYGNVPNHVIARRDVERHNCEIYLDAKERLVPIQEKWNERYPATPGNNRTQIRPRTD